MNSMLSIKLCFPFLIRVMTSNSIISFGNPENTYHNDKDIKNFKK